MSHLANHPFHEGQNRRWTPLAGDPALGFGTEHRFQYELQEPDDWRDHRQLPLNTHRSQASSISLEPSITSGSPPLLSNASVRPSNSRFKSWKPKTFPGWKAGVVLSAIAAAIAFLINLTLTIWAVANFSIDKDGLGTVIEKGSCTRAKDASLWLHLAINVLSSILLSASNYTMQTLSAPTRVEVDREHSKRDWLDIGLPSVRNLRRIARSRVIMWWCLGLSSVPLHLMYNSALFTTLAANEYAILIVTPEFLSGGQFSYSLTGVDLTEIHANATADRFQRLDNETCIKEYNKNFVSGRGDLIIVSTIHNSTETVLTAMTSGQPRDGGNITATVCNGNCQDGLFLDLGDIDYCLSQQVEERCKLQFSPYIMIVVILCNLVKSLTMGLAVWIQRTPTLVTLGDAVSSFLEDPDKSTEGLCLVTKTDILKGVWRQNRKPRVYKPVRNFWFRAASWQRWASCNFLSLLTLSIAGLLLNIGIRGLKDGATSFRDIYNEGLGVVTSNSLVDIGTDGQGPARILANVFLANLPQCVLSFLYLTYNGLYTCMLNADEWSRFAHQQKTLRVTAPSGKQRSTYYLQLPYTYAVPLLVLSGLLHWLTSQSIFLARVTFYLRDGEEEPAQSISTCGYSCIAIIFVIMAGSVALLVGAGMGFRRYPAGIPMAAGCSAAISAACHLLPNEDDAARLPLKWGVVSEGHCSFSARPVENPVAGKRYSGRARKRGIMVGNRREHHITECRPSAIL